MQQFREVSRTRTIYSTETHTSDFTTMQAINTTGFATSKKRKRKENKKLLPLKEEKHNRRPHKCRGCFACFGFVWKPRHCVWRIQLTSAGLRVNHPFRPFRSTKCWRVLISFWLTLIAWLWRFSNSSSPSWPGISQIFLLLPFFLLRVLAVLRLQQSMYFTL